MKVLKILASVLVGVILLGEIGFVPSALLSARAAAPGLALEAVSTPKKRIKHQKHKQVRKDVQPLQATIQHLEWHVLKHQHQPNSLLAFNQNFPKQAWWEQFDDPALSSHIQAALKNNPDLKSVAQQMEQARYLAEISKAAMLPTVQFNGTYLFQQYAQNQFLFPLASRTFASYQLPIQVNYELDLWQKNLKKYQLAKEQANAAVYDFHNAYIQLTTAVATAYWNLLLFEGQEHLQQEVVALAEKDLMHTRRLAEFAQVAESEVSRKTQQRDRAQADLSVFQAGKTLAWHQLQVLSGAPPDINAELRRNSLDAVSLPERLDAGIPDELLTHRPDVQKLEALMTAAALNIQIARREVLPSIKAQGQSGFSSVGLDKLIRSTSLSSFIYPMVTQPIYAGGVLKYGIKLRRAEYQALLQSYHATLLKAYQEVENTIATVSVDHDIYQRVHAQELAATNLAKMARQQFDLGLTGEPAWISEELLRLGQGQLRLQQKAQLLIDQVSLVKALGGGIPTVSQLSQQ